MTSLTDGRAGAAPLAAPAAPAQSSQRARRAPLPVRAVRIAPDSLLGRWQTRNATATIPHCIVNLEASGVLNNLRRVVGESGADYSGWVFADSDLYKVIEAVAWETARSGTHAFDDWLDGVIGLVQRVQEDSGYCHSWIQGVHPDKRFAELDWTHEMYVLGHMIQAAVALDRATGRKDLLRVATAFAALVERRFGPGREDGVPGHPEIETALVELFRHTGQERWLRLAEHLVNQRGRDILPDKGFGHRYYQDHTGVREGTDPTGHAVRQLYLNAGVTDLYLETGEELLHEVMLEQWDRAHERKMYLSGAFGSRHRDESFGNDYELPADRAYAETCATVADLHWTWRMQLAGSDRRYDDVIERELYNALAASLDGTGTRFFYSNPMQRRPDRFSEENAPAQRQPWYSCACCPPNIARTLAQVGAYVASVLDGSLLELHQLVACEIDLPGALGGGVLEVTTGYPADGEVRLAVHGTPLPTGTGVSVRVPAWAEGATVAAGGSRRPVSEQEHRDGRVLLRAEEVDGAVLSLPLEPRWTRANSRVDAVRGCVALERGPVVYCLEQADLPDGVGVDDVLLPERPEVATLPLEDGAPAPRLRAAAHVRAPETRLYPPASWDRTGTTTRRVDIELVPFSTWGNRGTGAMRVWIPTT
ncbi:MULTISPECIES: beta-L-arabinofuranosidase domain-containing protein [unclassified Actinomyces]|uniref:glycoside hydrolase family 127 protein n=1 Tax=unclassified Actinomyces TaxID=2609248 RepID=UPI002016EC53|nr:MULTISPECIES: beta-L-arabinofuranosidase domain-containing protein [unclassified Actinomyces]MCL3777133.1 glycoside hydrolase family 127 protein [Actinomyces sp. AC-20-1]MCL3788951.1 glycoside hydrolase family 127 protein [Actinomyces sp. 187325]MCL3791319.1 glycoside hydrolase family 127 protein [Actinomyces sp. 186855]MCL3794150.1 glycoside hydrolase family 127 protein [Actinomyces sp. 217892]